MGGKEPFEKNQPGERDQRDEGKQPGEREQPGPLLCLAAGLGQSGWAVFDGCTVVDSGVVGLRGRRDIARTVRIAHQVDALTSIAVRWKVSGVARCRTAERSGAVDTKLLDQSIRRWADEMGLPMRENTIRTVRATVTGRHSASKEDFCYAVMQRLRLVGETRPTVEWEAIAVGLHLLMSQETNRNSSPPGKGRG